MKEYKVNTLKELKAIIDSLPESARLMDPLDVAVYDDRIYIQTPTRPVDSPASGW